MVRTREEAVELASKAREEWDALPIDVREPVKKFFVRYGQGGVGWKPLCRVIFADWDPEEAISVKAYSRKSES